LREEAGAPARLFVLGDFDLRFGGDLVAQHGPAGWLTIKFSSCSGTTLEW
jgi:hypothetical protein